MEGLTFRDRIPTAEEYNELRDNVGWGTMAPALAEECLPRSLYGVSVYDEGKIIGCGRIVGDGGLCFYIQDVMVRDTHQKRGLGTEILTLLMAYLHGHAARNSYIGLMSAKGLEPFYEKFGFIRRPNDSFGSGMTQFWGRPGEASET